ncbi:MAG: AMP-binding protein, partial [Planctomycetales bacterium]|nr:AMP-binding protein [Planctomycetales bacterium]
THVGPLDGSNLPGTIGLPLPDTDCRIVDAETGERDLPVGEVGELLIRGPQVMLGYWNNPVATSEAIRDGWLHTGDLASVNAAGFYRIVDRKKDLIITSGFNVYPADVEESLRGCECVADVAVVGVPDAERGEVVKAFVVLKQGYNWEPKILTQYCKQHLAAHRRPRLWEHVTGDLPRNFLGKVLRRQLRDG